jgi:prophage DNA circulation protein
MTWDRQLEEASFRGVTFQTQRLSGSPSARRLAEYQYPGRDGSDFEDRGREPQRWSFTCVFTGDEYESELGQFQQVVDAGRSGRFTHPTHGTFTARVSITNLDESPDLRDTAIVQIEVVEDGTATALPDLFSVGGLADEVDFWADAVDAADTASVPTVTTAWQDAKAWASNVKAGVQGAIKTVNSVRRKIDNALKTMEDLTNPSNWQVVRSLKRLSYSCQKLATRAQNVLPKVKSQTATVPLPLALLAFKMYGDRTKVDQLLQANPTIRNSFVVQPGQIKTQVAV